MRFVVCLVSPVLLSLWFWLAFAACVDAPIGDPPPVARIVTSWDPLACGEPHRVVIELADDGDQPVSRSTPCTHGTLALDVPHLGTYSGRIYAWFLDGDPAVRSVLPLTLAVDDTIVRWVVQTPR